MQKNFEIIRFIQQGVNFHIILDSVQGQSLNEYLSKTQEIHKEELFEWINQIIRELICVENASSLQSYRFVLPFCMIIKNNRQIALLNLKTKSNQNRLEKILANPAINVFFPEDETYNDIYSFGKTLQYIFAHANLKHRLTRFEKKKIKRIISKCFKLNSKKSYQNFEDVLSDFSTIKRKKNFIVRLIFKLLLIGLGIILFIMLYLKPEEETEDMYMSAGFTYFAVLNDYVKSEELFSKAEHVPNAESYREMASFMQGNSAMSDGEMESLLQQLEEEAGLNYEQKYCILKVYDKLDSVSSDENVIRLAEEILESPDWYRNEKEIREILEKTKKLLKQGGSQEI